MTLIKISPLSINFSKDRRQQAITEVTISPFTTDVNHFDFPGWSYHSGQWRYLRSIKSSGCGPKNYAYEYANFRREGNEIWNATKPSNVCLTCFQCYVNKNGNDQFKRVLFVRFPSKHSKFNLSEV